MKVVAGSELGGRETGKGRHRAQVGIEPGSAVYCSRGVPYRKPHGRAGHLLVLLPAFLPLNRTRPGQPRSKQVPYHKHHVRAYLDAYLSYCLGKECVWPGHSMQCQATGISPSQPTTPPPPYTVKLPSWAAFVIDGDGWRERGRQREGERGRETVAR